MFQWKKLFLLERAKCQSLEQDSIGNIIVETFNIYFHWTFFIVKSLKLNQIFAHFTIFDFTFWRMSTLRKKVQWRKEKVLVHFFTSLFSPIFVFECDHLDQSSPGPERRSLRFQLNTWKREVLICSINRPDFQSSHRAKHGCCQRRNNTCHTPSPSHLVVDL